MFSDGEMSSLGGISISNYIIEDEIGRGTSGRVFKARSRTGGGPTVAIKLIAKKKLSGAAKDNLVNEIRQEMHRKAQCCGSGMFIPDLIFFSCWIPGPHQRI
jgi:hypothetical protein